MRCELSAGVTVQRLLVLAEMAWLEKRPELGLLCKGARDAGRLDEALVCRTLPGVTMAGARNLVRWCQTLRLCDKGGTLTRLGEAAAVDDECPVPEQGVYELWTATHPLFGGTRILHAERRRATRDGRLDETDPITDVPLKDVPFRSVLDPNIALVLRDLPRRDGGPARGKLLPTGARAEIRWKIDFTAGKNAWMLEGKLDGDTNAGGQTPSRRMQMKPEPVEIDLKSLFAGWASRYLPEETRWDPQRERLLVRFNGLTDEALEGFSASFALERVEVPGRGIFTKAALQDVPLAPRTSSDAQLWAEARLDRRLTDAPTYRSRAEVRDLFASVVRATPLAEHRPRTPAHPALTSRHAAQADVFWGLVAPVDLAPSPPGEALLGALSVSEEAAS